jgi:hypothetical protein
MSWLRIAWSGGVREALSDQAQVGRGEVVSDTEQRLVGYLADGVGQAVAEGQRRRMPPFAVAEKGIRRYGPVFCR